MNAPLAQISIHQQHLGAAQGQCASEVGGDGGFAFVRHCAGDDHNLGPPTFDHQVEECRTKVAIGLGIHMPVIVARQKSQWPFFCKFGNLRHLTDNIVTKPLGHFDQRIKPVVTHGQKENNPKAKSQSDDDGLRQQGFGRRI